MNKSLIPNDPRIYNRPDEDGNYPPIKDFFNGTNHTPPLELCTRVRLQPSGPDGQTSEGYIYKIYQGNANPEITFYDILIDDQDEPERYRQAHELLPIPDIYAPEGSRTIIIEIRVGCLTAVYPADTHYILIDHDNMKGE